MKREACCLHLHSLHPSLQSERSRPKFKELPKQEVHPPLDPVSAGGPTAVKMMMMMMMLLMMMMGRKREACCLHHPHPRSPSRLVPLRLLMSSSSAEQTR